MFLKTKKYSLKSYTYQSPECFTLILINVLLMEDSFSLFIVKGTDKNLTNIGGKKHEIDHYKKSKTLNK